MTNFSEFFYVYSYNILTKLTELKLDLILCLVKHAKVDTHP